MKNKILFLVVSILVIVAASCSDPGNNPPPVNRTISFVANGGSGSMDNCVVTGGSSFTLPANAFTRTDFGFRHWNTKDDDSGTVYNNGASLPAVNADLTLYAIWGHNPYTVTFDANLGTGAMAPASAAPNENYLVPACDFTRDDYVFAHWNTQSDDSGTSYNVGSSVPSVNADFTLYAVWTPLRYVTFDANLGSGSMAQQSVVDGADFTVPGNSFTRNTWTFTHWNTQANNTGTDYYQNDVISSVHADITLYAIWTANPRSISYGANGGSGTMPGATVEYGHQYTVSSNEFTYANHTFLRWHDVRSGGDYTAGQLITVADDMVMQAVWADNPIVSFYGGGGSGSMANASVGYGASYTIPANGFTYDMQTFRRWRDESGNSYAPGSSVTLTQNLVLTAVWSPNPIITFVANGASGSMASANVPYGGTFTVPANGFTYTNFTFLNWHDEGNLDLTPGTTLTLTGNLVLTAQWAAYPVISFVANGGSGTMSDVRVPYGSTYTIPVNGFTRSNFAFLNWNDGATTRIPGATLPLTGNLVLTAQWAPYPVVSFVANGGGGTMANVTVVYGTNYLVPNCAFTYAGHTFVNWLDGSTPRAPGSTVTALTSNMALTAQWAVNPVIHFAAGGGSGAMADATVAYGGTYTVPANGFTRDGYTFLRWRDGNNVEHLVGSTVTLTSDITLTAVWAQNPAITFSSGGADGGSMTNTSVSYGGVYTLPACGYTYTQHTFLHWRDANGLTYQPGSTVTLTGNIALTAVWQIIPLVTFNPNQAAGTVPVTGTMANVSVPYGNSYSIPASGYARRTYSFVRWNTAADGSGTSYNAGAPIASLTTNLNLYAIWARNSNVIKYMGFDEGLGVNQMFDSIIDAGSTVSIVNNPPSGANGNALRAQLTNVHLLDARINGATNYQDFWLAYDYYLQYANGTGDAFPASDHVPLVIVCDSDSGGDPVQLIGTPLFNYYAGGEDTVVGLPRIRTLTNITNLTDRILGIRHDVTNPAGTWHHIKIHVKTDTTLAGISINIDGEQWTTPAISEGVLPNAHFDTIRVWYHNLDDGSFFPAPNTNIFFDNIGVYADDPDNHPD